MPKVTNRPDGEERDKLDDQFEGDRRDHAFVPLARIDMTRAEQDREVRHHKRHVEFGVLQDRCAEVPSASRFPDTGDRIEKLVEIALSWSEI